MKTVIAIFTLILTSVSAFADESMVFRPLFMRIATNSAEFGMYENSIREWGLENGSWRRNPEQSEMVRSTISAMSNCIEQAVCMIPEVITNGLCREIFLHMSGYAGTNVFFRIWDELLDISETNSSAFTPAMIDDFWSGATTPLYEYVTFHYDLPVCQTLLSRTRDLFPTNDPRHSFLVNVISGEEKRRSIDYYLNSGEELPVFAE